ncbi:MAG TPA: hypothetical protein VNV39_03055 [Stellaceae bacterium]|nr:hypothetical protein [Stellaceae bacterium]
MDKEALSTFFAIHRAKFDRCLEPQMRCEQTAIRAHSIQNARTLDLLTIDNHVIALRPRASETGIQIDYKSVGRNDASTFTGFCSEHDRDIFAPIDTATLDTTNSEQRFLLAYRAVSFELHAIIEKAAKIQNIYRARVGLGWDSPDATSEAGRLATADLLHAFITWRYRAENFDADLLVKNYSNIQHDVIIFDNQKPCIAVSSLFSIEGVTREDDNVRIALNVLPMSPRKTVAVFAYHNIDAELGRSGLTRVLQATGEQQKYELSKLIIRKMSNFYISPAHFAAWSPGKADRIKAEFVSTVLREHRRDIRHEVGEPSQTEHQDFMLF